MKHPLAQSLAVAMLSLAAGVSAVELSHDGRGDVLIYPFYSAAGGNDTYISVANNTDQAKALRVRFREGMENQEVLSFNLYLGPRDHWSGAVTTHGDSARLISQDASCTYPYQPEGGFVFSDAAFIDAPVYAITERTREGLVEIIEMGILDDEETHSERGPFGAVEGIFGEGVSSVDIANGMDQPSPAPVMQGCSVVGMAWETGYAFEGDPSRNIGPATGGLSGHGVVINVNEGTNITYNAVALNKFFDGGFLHAHPDDASPSLEDAAPVARIYHNSLGLIEAEVDRGVDAVSAVLMRSEISSDLVRDPGINAATDWVISFPTLQYYVYTDIAESPDTPYPSGALLMRAYDREGESSYARDADLVDFAVGSRGDHGILLHTAVNVLGFKVSQPVLQASSRIGRNIAVKEGLDNGHAVLDLRSSRTPMIQEQNRLSLDSDQGTLELTGIPLVGFAAQKYVNGNINGVLSNYTGSLNFHSTLDAQVQQD